MKAVSGRDHGSGRHEPNVMSIGTFAGRFFAPEIRAWRGQQPLWKVFWIYGVVVSSGVVALYASALYAGHRAMQQALLLVFAVYTLWILVSVWRCATNVGERFWGVLARFLTIAWAGNTLMVLLFVELDLLARIVPG
jgi:hypothetical protein